MSAPLCLRDDCDAIAAAQWVNSASKEQRRDVDMQRLAALVVRVDLGVYRVTQQGPAVRVVVFDVIADIQQ